MTGWRLGWLLVPDDLVDAVDRLAGNFALCPPVLAQHAAVAAFDAYDELDANVVRYRTNRDLLLERLPEVGITHVAPPDGAFYVYADVGAWTDDSLTWSARLLAETGVAVAPGVDFDPVAGGRWIRMSFAGDTDALAVTTEVLGTWLDDQPAIRSRRGWRAAAGTRPAAPASRDPPPPRRRAAAGRRAQVLAARRALHGTVLEVRERPEQVGSADVRQPERPHAGGVDHPTVTVGQRQSDGGGGRVPALADRADGAGRPVRVRDERVDERGLADAGMPDEHGDVPPCSRSRSGAETAVA